MQPQRVLSAVGWVALVAVAVLASPPAAPDADETLRRLLTGHFADLNGPLVALFNLMGVYPLAFFALLAFDAPTQRVPLWPFVLASFALGAFALLPGLALRQWGLPRRPADAWWRRVLRGRWVGLALSLAALGLAAGFALGDLEGFGALLRTQQFPFVMSCDFVACWLAGAMVGREEAHARGQPELAWAAWLPAVGLPLVALLRRPPQGT